MKRLLLPLAFVIGAAALLMFRLGTAPTELAPPKPTYPDFTVTTASGAIALSDLRPRAVVVVFGYTSCPDICPTNLLRLGAAFRKLPPELEARTRAVFVTVDPERDTLERLAEYAPAFHPTFVGGIVSDPTLDELTKTWGIFYERHDGDSAMGYTMDHSSQAFLLDSAGQVVAHIPHDASPDAMAAALLSAHRPAP